MSRYNKGRARDAAWSQSGVSAAGAGCNFGWLCWPCFFLSFFFFLFFFFFVLPFSPLGCSSILCAPTTNKYQTQHKGGVAAGTCAAIACARHRNCGRYIHSFIHPSIHSLPHSHCPSQLVGFNPPRGSGKAQRGCLARDEERQGADMKVEAGSQRPTQAASLQLEQALADNKQREPDQVGSSDGAGKAMPDYPGLFSPEPVSPSRQDNPFAPFARGGRLPFITQDRIGREVKVCLLARSAQRLCRLAAVCSAPIISFCTEFHDSVAPLLQKSSQSIAIRFVDDSGGPRGLQ